MAEHTEISWADHTFNPWIGCMKVSPACDGCYAEALMGLDGRMKRAEWGAPGKGVGTRVRTAPANWRQPLAWDRAAAKAGTRPFVFCASLADVFDNAVDKEWRFDLFELINKTPHLTWLLLTKRPQNIVKLFTEAMHLLPGGEAANWPFNAAIGCTVVSQEEADRDVPQLLRAKAKLKPAFAFLSMEPLLGAVNLTDVANDGDSYWDALRGHPAEETFDGVACEAIDWVITGGETDQGGHKARPQHVDWFRSIRDQCAAAGVAYHHKQNGEWGYCPDRSINPDHLFKVGKKYAGRLLDGVTHDARPA